MSNELSLQTIIDFLDIGFEKTTVELTRAHMRFLFLKREYLDKFFDILGLRKWNCIVNRLHTDTLFVLDLLSEFILNSNSNRCRNLSYALALEETL
jgi:hypothetical protein